LTLPLFQERSFRLEVADQSGSLIGARVAAEWPAGLETLEDPFDLYIAPIDGKPTEVFVGWAVLVCEYRGRLMLDQAGSALTLQFAPSPGCELAPISQGVILEFSNDVEARALTGRQSREPLVELEGFLPSAIAFADRNVGWIGGTNAKSDALILHTVDGGATWTTSGLGPGSVREIAAIDARNAYSTLVCIDHEVACPSGTFSWDDDFGGWGGKAVERFVAIDFAGERGIAVALPRDDTASMVASLLLNEDGGDTEWPPIEDPCTAGTFLADAERTSDVDLFVLCLGEGGTGGTFKTLLASADRGASWVERASTRGQTLPISGSPYGFDLASDGSGWMWGSRMPLLHTTDAGASWTNLDVADGDVRIVNDASYLGTGSGFVIVQDPDRQAILLLWTRDGQTWDELGTWPLQ
jgi:hypothetical protein